MGLSGVHIFHRGDLDFMLWCERQNWGMEWRQLVKSVEDSWSGGVWGPRVIYRLEIRCWAWNLKKDKYSTNCINIWWNLENKRPTGHIYSINIFRKIIERKIISFLKIKWSFVCRNLNLLRPRMSYAMFSWISPVVLSKKILLFPFFYYLSLKNREPYIWKKKWHFFIQDSLVKIW